MNLKRIRLPIPTPLSRLYRQVQLHDVSGAAAELAYRFFLALFPFLIFLAALGGFMADLFGVQNPTQQIMDAIGRSIPADAASILRGELNDVVGSHDVGLVSIGIIGALWAASSGIGTVIKVMNRAYGVRETRPIYVRWAMSIGLTVLGSALLVGAFLFLVGGQIYGEDLAGRLGMAGQAQTLFTLARWPLVLLMVLLASSVVYWAAPNMRLSFRWTSPGAVLFSLGWLAMSYLFGLYVSHFGSYNATYGTLGGVAVVLIWFYLTGYILLTGAELNAMLHADALERRSAAVAQPTIATLPSVAEPADEASNTGSLPYVVLAGLGLLTMSHLAHKQTKDLTAKIN